MPISPYVTLDGRGILTDAASIVDARLTDYFFSVRSQDPNFIVHSLIYDLARAGDDEASIRLNIQTSLEALLSPYFEQVDISVNTEVGTNNQISISLGVTVVDNGVPINVGKVLKTRNSKLMEVADKIYSE